MNYSRVVPRDLFNESKLLKCIGQLVLDIEDRKISGVTYTHYDSQIGFEIRQDESDGSISVANIIFEANGESVRVYTPMNSREKYPLIMETLDYEEFTVFTEEGKISYDLLEYLERL